MRAIQIIAFFTLVLSLNGFSQTKFPVKLRAEKQAMSTPMTALEEVIFTNYYIAKPVNIKFDGSVLNMYFDDGSTVANKNVTEVNRETELDDNNKLMLETIKYTDNSNKSDTISYVINHIAGFVHLVVPAKNSKGEYIGYTSYRQSLKNIELASK